MRIHLTGSVTGHGRPDQYRDMYIDVSEVDKNEVWAECYNQIFTKEDQECVANHQLKLIIDPELSVDWSGLPEDYTFKPDDNGLVHLEYAAVLHPKPRLAYIREGLGLMALAMFIAVLSAAMYHDSEMCYEYEHPYGQLGAGISAALFMTGVLRLP